MTPLEKSRACLGLGGLFSLVLAVTLFGYSVIEERSSMLRGRQQLFSMGLVLIGVGSLGIAVKLVFDDDI